MYTMFISNNHTSFHSWWKKNLIKHQKVLKMIVAVFSCQPRSISLMCLRWKNYSQVSLLILFSPQSLPPCCWTGCFLYHFSNDWIETYSSECQNVLRLCAFPLSIVNLLVNQYIGEFCLYNVSQYQQREMRDYKILERSVQANIKRNITSLGKLSC